MRRVPDLWSETNSGIAVIVPAWRLLKLLEEDHLVQARRREEIQISNQRRQNAK
jgi:hypothetical protein